jgi:hypothetical protein
LVGNECTRPLTPEARERLSKFLTATDHYGTPALDSQIDDEISKLMISFRSARTISSEEANATVTIYIEILRGLPLWAIRDGFNKVKLGEVEGVSLDFPPSAPRLRKVVTDEMIPIRADRSEVTRILAAKEAPPENPVMAKRTEPLVRGALNRMQQKYGPNYGLGHIEPAVNIQPKAAPKPDFQPMNWTQVCDHYKQVGVGHLLGDQYRKIHRNDRRDNDHDRDETFHDDDDREAVSQ